MKKTAICFVIIIVSLVTGFVIYNKQMEKCIHNEKIALGKQNACAYMREKYDTDFEVINAEVVMDDDIFSTFEGDNVFVTVRKNNGKYHVEISGVEESTDGCDDYQADEIENALIDMIKADIKDFEYDFGTYGMYRQCYRAGDTNSLKDVLSEQHENLYVYCVNNDLEEVPVFDFLRHNVNECVLYSFSSQEILDDFMSDGLFYIDWYAPYITGYRVVNFPKSDNERRKYDMKSCGDLLYYVPHEKTDGKIENGFSEISASELDWIDGEYKIVSPVYELKEKCYDVNVWIPLTDGKFYFAVEYNNVEKGKIQEIKECQIIGDYAFYQSYCSTSDLKIALLCK